MAGHNFRKFISAILSSAIVAGVMVVLIDQAPIEMPYYDGAWEQPISSPRLDSLYNTEPAYEAQEAEAEAVKPQVEAIQRFQEPAESPYQARAGYTSYSSRAE